MLQKVLKYLFRRVAVVEMYTRLSSTYRTTELCQSQPTHMLKMLNMILLCAFNEDKVVGKINRIVEIPEGDEDALMEAVANKVARDVEYWMDNWTVSDVI